MPGAIWEIKERAAAELLALPGVVGVGIGGRERAGRPTGELVIKVFVERKLPPHAVPAGTAVPESFAGAPIDVEGLGPLRLSADPSTGPPLGVPKVSPDRIDRRRQRKPLVGGCMTQSELTGALGGTLGCFLIHKTDRAQVFGLSNHHIIGTVLKTGQLSTPGVTKIGQPTGEDSPTECCSDIIGRYAGGGFDGIRDAALVRLDAKHEWKARVLDIGDIAGAGEITEEEARSQTHQVRKRGMRTGLTGGTVKAIGVEGPVLGQTFRNIMIIKPNPDPSQPAGTQVFFSDEGDSGAVLVDAANLVVGLHFVHVASGPDAGASASIPIKDVLDSFATVEQLPLEVATPAIHPLHLAELRASRSPAPGTVRAAVEPAPRPRPASPPPELVRAVGEAPPAGAFDRLQDDLDSSPAGRRFIGLWLTHHRELLGLVEGNRRVTIAWHRGGGAALVQFAVRMMGRPDLAFPQTLYGRPLAECLDRLHETFARHAGPALCRDLDQARADLPDLAGLTYAEVMAALRTR